MLVDTSVLVGGPGIADVGGAGSVGAWSLSAWFVSAVSVGELETGVLTAADVAVRAARLNRLTTVLRSARVLPVDGAVASHYARLRVLSRRRPTNDLWIAATALAHDLPLVTADLAQAALPLIRSRLVPD